MSRAFKVALAITLVTALVPVVSGTAVGSGRHGLATRCPDVNMPQIRATHVRASRISCSFARLTIRRYFRKVLASAQENGGCAQQRSTKGCRVRSFRCYTTGTYSLKGLCTGPFGQVRFREHDVGPS